MSTQPPRDALINPAYDLGKRTSVTDSVSETSAGVPSPTLYGHTAESYTTDKADGEQTLGKSLSHGHDGSARSRERKAFMLAYPQTASGDSHSYYAGIAGRPLSSPNRTGSSLDVHAKPVDSVIMDAGTLLGRQSPLMRGQPIVNPDYSLASATKTHPASPAQPSSANLSTAAKVLTDQPVSLLSKPGIASRYLSAERNGAIMPQTLEERLQRYRAGSDSHSIVSSQEQNYAARPASYSSFQILDSTSAHPPSPATNGRAMSISRVRRAGTMRSNHGGGSESKWSSELESQLQKAVQEKAHLEGKLQALNSEYALAFEQRAEYQSNMAKLQAQLEHERSSAAATIRREHRLASDLERAENTIHELRCELAKADGTDSADWRAVDEFGQQIKDLQASLHLLNDEAKAHQQENNELRTALEMANSERDRVEAEKVHLSSQLAALDNSSASLSEANESLQQQAKSLRSLLDAAREELSASKAANLALSVELERSRGTAADAEVELRRLQAQTLQQQGELVQSLEQFEAEAAAREEELHREAQDKSSAAQALEKAYREAARECAALLRATSELKSQLQMAEQRRTEAEQRNERLAEDKANLEGMVSSLEEVRARLDSEVESAASSLASHQNNLQALQTEKYVAEQALAGEQERRIALEEDLQRLQTSVQQLEQGLRVVEGEADHRHKELEEEKQKMMVEVEEERQRNGEREGELIEDLSRLRGQLRAEEARAAKLQDEKSTLTAVADGLHAESKQLHAAMMAAEAERDKAQHEAAAALRAAAELQRHEQEERARADVQTSMKAAELERAVAAKVAAEKEVEHFRQQLAVQQQAIEQELRAATDAAALARRELEEDKRALVKQAQEATREKERVEYERDRVKQRADHLQHQLADAERECGEAKQSRHAVEQELQRALDDGAHKESELQSHMAAIEELTMELDAKQGSCEEAEALARDLAEQLEREQGRLAGVTSAQATLRHHAGSLEAALAKKDYSLGQLSSQTASALAEKEAEDAAASRKVQQLSGELEATKDALEKVKSELARQRQEKQQHQEKHSGLQASLSQALQRCAELDGIRSQLRQSQAGQQQLRNELLHRTADCEAAQEELEQLKRELLNHSAQQPEATEQVRVLNWQNEQMAMENAALKEQLKLMEGRHEKELASLQEALRVADAARVTGRPQALSLVPTPPRNGQSTPTDKSQPYDVASLRGKLGKKHKTLSGLQGCLSSLRGEMEKLQLEMSRQSEAVQASNTTCRALESRLRGLKPASSVNSLSGSSPTQNVSTAGDSSLYT